MATSIYATFTRQLKILRLLPTTTQYLSVRHRRYRDQHHKQAIPTELLETYRTIETNQEEEFSYNEICNARSFRYAHPEFLPDSNPALRDSVKEQLERTDMMKRRKTLDIPEFYVGSIMTVTLSDPYADGFESRFVGICIQRAETGLRHNFTLRNVIDGMGVEIMYEMYNPTVKKIEVLKLEKRLDEELLYLKDAPHEYSTIPSDMEATPHPKGATVPVNDIKVSLNPRPWKERWERKGLKGIQDLNPHLTDKKRRMMEHRDVVKPWEKYDLMKMYRESVPLEDQDAAYLHFSKEQKRLDAEKSAELDKKIKDSRKESKKSLDSDES